MSETVTDTESQTGQDTASGRFLPGNQLGVHGRASPKLRAKAKCADFVIDFRSRHGREPTRAEYGRLHKAALLEVDAERARTEADRAKSSNSSEKILRSLRMDRPVRGVASAPKGSTARAGELLKRHADEC